MRPGYSVAPSLVFPWLGGSLYATAASSGNSVPAARSLGRGPFRRVRRPGPSAGTTHGASLVHALSQPACGAGLCHTLCALRRPLRLPCYAATLLRVATRARTLGGRTLATDPGQGVSQPGSPPCPHLAALVACRRTG